MIVKENKRYITVAEYCEYINKSKQAIYPKLEKSLKPYVIEIDGKKYIDSVVFIKYHHQEADPTEEVKGSQGFSTPKVNESQGISSEFLKFLQDQITEKDKQIALLQQQNADLQQSNKEKDTHIIEQANKITLLLEQSQELQRNSQILLATANNTEQAENTDTIAEVEKKGFFKRLFGR